MVQKKNARRNCSGQFGQKKYNKIKQKVTPANDPPPSSYPQTNRRRKKKSGKAAFCCCFCCFSFGLPFYLFYFEKSGISLARTPHLGSLYIYTVHMPPEREERERESKHTKDNCKTRARARYTSLSAKIRTGA